MLFHEQREYILDPAALLIGDTAGPDGRGDGGASRPENLVPPREPSAKAGIRPVAVGITGVLGEDRCDEHVERRRPSGGAAGPSLKPFEDGTHAPRPATSFIKGGDSHSARVSLRCPSVSNVSSSTSVSKNSPWTLRTAAAMTDESRMRQSADGVEP